MLSCKSVERALRSDMKTLSPEQLKQFAEDMGVETDGLSYGEIVAACVGTELYAFTH